ncbi:MAG: hypothetical protein AAF391_08490 [Bacteroidota bacterium]
MNQHSNQSNKAIIIVIAAVIVLGLAAVWYFFMFKPAQEEKEQARLEQIAQQEAEQKRKEQAAQRKARYDQLIANADSEFQLENWVTAQSLYSEASSLLSNQQYPKDQLVLVNAKLDEIAALEARRAAGEVDVVSEPTGRFYVIISSSVDDDTATDYARKLAYDGNVVKVVEHQVEGLIYYGVSVGDYDTWDEAVSASTSFSSFGTVWILKN